MLDLDVGIVAAGLVLALEVLAGLLDEDVVEASARRRSSDSTRIPASSSARTTGAIAAAPSATSTISFPSFAGSRSPKRSSTSMQSVASPSASPISSRGLPTSALSEAGVPSATILPALMIPTRSASWSASSRYWVVRKTVVPSSLRLRDLLPDRLAADRVEAGGRLVEEEHAGLVDERGGEVEPALHPARVGADAAVGGLRQPDPAEQRVGAPVALGAVEAVEGRLQPDQLLPVISGSSAASWSATPIAERTAAGSLDDVVAGDPGAAAGRPQQRGQHPHRGRLAGAVRAEERVDLALGDLEVDPGDGEDLVGEGPLQVGYLDRGHDGAFYSGCGRIPGPSRLNLPNRRSPRRNLSGVRVLGTLRMSSTEPQQRQGARQRSRGFAVLLIGVVALTMAALAPGKAAKVLGKAGNSPDPQMPEGICSVLASVTAFQTTANGKRPQFKVPADGHIVAWSVDLSRPDEGRPRAASGVVRRRPEARLSILKQQNKGTSG